MIFFLMFRYRLSYFTIVTESLSYMRGCVYLGRKKCTKCPMCTTSDTITPGFAWKKFHYFSKQYCANSSERKMLIVWLYNYNINYLYFQIKEFNLETICFLILFKSSESLLDFLIRNRLSRPDIVMAILSYWTLRILSALK